MGVGGVNVFALPPTKPEAVVRYLLWLYQPSVDITEFSRRLSEFTPSIGSMRNCILTVHYIFLHCRSRTIMENHNEVLLYTF